jgi:hypothetical protein
MARGGIVLVWLLPIALMVWLVPRALADECPERIDEAKALIRQAEQALAQRGTPADRADIQEQLKAVQALVQEAIELHDSNAHDPSVEKAYAALAAVKEVLKALKP